MECLVITPPDAGKVDLICPACEVSCVELSVGYLNTYRCDGCDVQSRVTVRRLRTQPQRSVCRVSWEVVKEVEA